MEMKLFSDDVWHSPPCHPQHRAEGPTGAGENTAMPQTRPGEMRTDG